MIDHSRVTVLACVFVDRKGLHTGSTISSGPTERIMRWEDDLLGLLPVQHRATTPVAVAKAFQGNANALIFQNNPKSESSKAQVSSANVYFVHVSECRSANLPPATTWV